jgi:hypothetical protein
MYVYKKLAQTLQAMENCARSGNAEWHEKHKQTVHAIVKEYMPSGSGFDVFCDALLQWVKE